MDLYADLQTNTALSLHCMQYNLLSDHPSLSSAALSVSVVFRAASQLTLSSDPGHKDEPRPGPAFRASGAGKFSEDIMFVYEHLILTRFVLRHPVLIRV